MEAETELPEPSKYFVDAVCDGGTPKAVCGFCGRTHFTSGPGFDMDDGEIDRLRAMAVTEPGRYIEDGANDSVAVGEIDGYEVVWNCPCRRLSKYERFIWGNRRVILEYLRARTTAERNEAADAMDAIQF